MESTLKNEGIAARGPVSAAETVVEQPRRRVQVRPRLHWEGPLPWLMLRIALQAIQQKKALIS